MNPKMNVNIKPNKNVEKARRYLSNTFNIPQENSPKVEAIPIRRGFLTKYAPLLLGFIPQITHGSVKITSENSKSFTTGIEQLLSKVESTDFMQRVGNFLVENNFIVEFGKTLIMNIIQQFQEKLLDKDIDVK